MFLKNVKQLFSQSGSIISRLTFFYSLATSILLVVITSCLYFGMLNILYKGNYQLLADEIQTIKILLQDKNINHSLLKQEIDNPLYELGEPLYHYYIQLIDGNQNIIAKTANIDPALSNAPFFKNISQLNNEEEVSAQWTSPNKKTYLMSQTKIKDINNQEWFIQVALDASMQNAKLNEYRINLIIMLIAGIIVAIILGFFIARRGMKSLYELTKATEKISITSLDHRIDPQCWPLELRDLGEAFNSMLARIEMSFLQLNQFSSDLAHELRTPINSLMLELEVTLTENGEPEDYQQILSSNLEELQHLSKVIENILFLAKTENCLPYTKTDPTIQVHQEIAVIFDFYQALADEKQIDMIYQGQGTLKLDPIMFRRLISNLLSNALKYTSPGGQVMLNIQENKQSVTISIRDTGIGIAEENLPKIFNRFYRVDSSRSPSISGVGLGLSIVKSIMDLYQGQITVHSQVGIGTLIVLIFPNSLK